MIFSNYRKIDIAAVRRHQKRADFLQQGCCCGSPDRARLVLGAEDWGGADIGSSMVPCCRVS